MGKRGPQASGGYSDKSAVLSTRITSGLRGALEEAAAQSGRTLSSEIEHRLRRSFDEDEKLVDVLGGRQMFALLRAISSAMIVAGTGWVAAATDKNKRNSDWLNDPELFERVVQAANAVLEALRPPGARPRWAHFGGPNFGTGITRLMLQDISEADGTQPSPAEDIGDTDRLFRRIASDLGPTLHGRLKKEEDDGSR